MSSALDRQVEAEQKAAPPEQGRLCQDFDEDCDGVLDHAACYRYAPHRGICPYVGTRTPHADAA